MLNRWQTLPITLNKMNEEEIFKKNVKSLFENIEKSHIEFSKSFFSFFKGITTMSTGLIALLIGLKPDKIPDLDSKVFFLLSISLIGLCILFSLIVQYKEVYLKKSETEIREQQLKKFLKDKADGDVLIDNIPVNKFYVFFEKMTYYCLLLSIISLVLYVYFLEF